MGSTWEWVAPSILSIWVSRARNSTVIWGPLPCKLIKLLKYEILVLIHLCPPPKKKVIFFQIFFCSKKVLKFLGHSWWGLGRFLPYMALYGTMKKTTFSKKSSKKFKVVPNVFWEAENALGIGFAWWNLTDSLNLLELTCDKIFIVFGQL
jgi:hypothetical protein